MVNVAKNIASSSLGAKAVDRSSRRSSSKVSTADAVREFLWNQLLQGGKAEAAHASYVLEFIALEEADVIAASHLFRHPRESWIRMNNSSTTAPTAWASPMLSSAIPRQPFAGCRRRQEPASRAIPGTSATRYSIRFAASRDSRTSCAVSGARGRPRARSTPPTRSSAVERGIHDPALH